MRYRKGSKGLYYTDGKLDECSYNQRNCSFIDLIIQNRIDSNDMENLVEYLIHGLQALLFLLILPITPLIRAIYIRRRTIQEKVPTDKFESNYYQEI